MGLGRGLVKKVFCRSKSPFIGARDGNERNFGLDKSRWTSVRLYLCGDELNSVIVENDSASIRSSEVRIMQQLEDNSGDGEICQAAEVEVCKDSVSEEENQHITEFGVEEAAILIQSAFRGFMVRKQYKEARECCEVDGSEVEDPSGVNEAASTDVLVDDSTEIFRIHEGNGSIQDRSLLKSRSQTYRLKDEWDDSTLSSDTLRVRIQNRLEASTRRERALAYAFSQQLRACTARKKQNLSDSHEEPNMGWTWLERWMATRVPENTLVEDCWSKHLEPVSADRRLPMIAKKSFDISFEGKESCGSNDVPVTLEGVALPSETPTDCYNHFKNKFKATKSVSRRKAVPEYHRSSESTKVNKRVSRKESEEKKQKQVVEKPKTAMLPMPTT